MPISALPTRNSLCWCGSGSKFKFCHQDRHLQTPLPVGQRLQEAKKVWSQKRCMHPDASYLTCSNLISAHTLSRRALLTRIADSDNHVMTFKSPDPLSERLAPVRLGWKNASTFPGFCSRHDAVFNPIEIGSFSSSPEHCFLLTYRGICHEVFEKRAALEMYEQMRSTVDLGFSHQEQVRLQDDLGSSIAGIKKGLKELGAHKSLLDATLSEKNYGDWQHVVFIFEGPVSIASVGAISPNRSLSGIELQSLHDPNTPQQPLLFGIAATETGSAIVLFWRRGHTKVLSFVEEILQQDPSRIGGLLIQVSFAYLSNTYFSNEWWAWLSQASKLQLTTLAAMSNAYYTNFEYKRFTFAKWKLSTVLDRRI